LIVIRGADEGKQFELAGPLLGAGRDAANQIRLHDTEVSRRHAEFRELDSGGYRLVDIGSANGTFVNNMPVKETVLHPGDQVQLGQTVFVYSAGPNGRGASDLADRISMITRQDAEFPSSIITTVDETEGSRILSQPHKAGTPWLQSALADLSVMYEVVHAVSHTLDIDQLLQKIMALVLRSIEADRGCIMLRNPDTSRFEPKAVRWRETEPHDEKMTISRTIMEHVLREKEGVLVSDAAHDQRFTAGQSIIRFGIQEAICVPMKGRHETLGVLYLDTCSTPRDLLADHRLAAGKFNEDHLKLAIAIAHQAALAVEDTRYHQAMLQAERLAAIGQAIAALSHHIKNILQGLRSGSEILKMGLADKNDDLVQQGWKIVEKNQGKIYEMVMEMLTYSKEREPAIEETNLNSIIRDVLELIQARVHDSAVKLEARLSDDLPPVPADPEGIHRAVLNVVSNALDAVEDKKNAHVGVLTTLESDGQWVRVVVIDNGNGIAPHKQPEIFRPFVSTKGAKGTGLGLAVSRKILREHGGEISVQSQVGKGSKFIMRLPLKSPVVSDVYGTKHQIPAFNPPEPD
jgi:signal transduction histidine kinase